MSNPPPAGKLYSYYRDSGISPTFGSLQTEADLDRFCEQRARIFTLKLQMPPEMFRDARLLEFGPDTGENALAFARWGARIELVEPNTAVWPQLQAYFRHFGLENQLLGLHDKPIQEFAPAEQADIVVAEGFIHTVKPEKQWIDVVRQAVRPNGYLILFYYERRGLLMEVFHAALYREFRRMAGQKGPDAARRLYGAKWDAIAHVRRFNSWVMDVLENPYTHSQFTLDAPRLIQMMAESDFELHQSWPRYRDDLRMQWHKAPESPSSIAAEVDSHLQRSALSHALGRTLYCIGDNASVAAVGRQVDELLHAVDQALDVGGRQAWTSVAKGFVGLQSSIDRDNTIYAPSAEARRSAKAMLDSASRCATLAADGDAERLATFANADQSFVSFWGQPAHYSVFRKRARTDL
ncbi:MAG: methyltransferase domain-containing protein [Reyranella sp.]|nr:methyltransferase domain-containing protein [Reyranella sp.]MDP3160384.1 methyltransferase domain-containing protein [Reyranella sp.]